MSTPFYDLASLVVVPSGYKSGKIYAPKPLTTDGQLTFTRASNATRVASNGLIEKVRTNVALYSEQFDNAAYTKLDATVTANAVANPLNGAVTADKIVENTANSLHRVGQGAISVTSGVPITFSFIAKAGERTQLEVQRINTSGTVFNALSNNIINLTTGVVPAITGATSYGSISLGNGWFRYYITLTPIASATGGLNLGLVNGSGNVSYTGDGTSGAFVFGFQAEIGDVMTDYIATTTTAVSVGPVSGLPRLDYLNSTCPRLLLEPQRTNLALYSEQFNNAAWTGDRYTITANSVASPDGYTNADTFTATNTSGTHNIGPVTLINLGGVAGTMSVFAKYNGSNLSLSIAGSSTNWTGCVFDLQNGVAKTPQKGGSQTVCTAKIEDYGNGWYRCSISYTPYAGGAFYTFIGSVSSATATLGSFGLEGYTADGTSGFYLYGVQVELGAYATSYIPTLSTSVTRVVDAAIKTGISSLIGATEGTFYAEFTRGGQGGANQSLFSLTDGSSNNRLRIISTSGDALRILFQLNGNVIQYDASTTSVFVSSYTQQIKIAVAYKSGDIAVYINGQLFNASTNTLTFSAPLSDYAIDAALNSNIVNQALVFKTRLTNAQLAELTTL